MKKCLLQFWPLYILTAAIFILFVSAGSRAVAVIAENLPIERKNLIIIDAGHGGEDGGATSCTGILESQINLEIALKLNELCHLLGYDTQMIRTSDISVYTEGNTIAAKKASDLRNRVQTVNNAENALLISIHQNTFSDSRYSGAQVFYAKTEGSKDLAEMLQRQVSSINPGSKRQVKPADNVYLMQHIQKPGVLIECGFISNPEEEAKLLSADYQKKLCCVIAATLSCYLNT